MKVIKGDLIKMAKNKEFDVIVHGCNCFCTMGAGIAAQIVKEYPEAYKADLGTQKGDERKLGTISIAYADTVTIVNAYTQYDYSSRKRCADYDAIRSCFRDVRKTFHNLKIGYPLIACGLAGGDWNIVSKIIDEELAYENHTLVKFDG